MDNTTPCRDCRGHVSRSAPICPHCGALSPASHKGNDTVFGAFGWIVTGVSALIIVTVVVLVLVGG